MARPGQIKARYEKANAYVNKLAQSILAKAFRGELVSQDPNDPPASELLERIKAAREKAESHKKNQKRPPKKPRRRACKNYQARQKEAG